jgi:hypothetical protein
MEHTKMNNSAFKQYTNKYYNTNKNENVLEIVGTLATVGSALMNTAGGSAIVGAAATPLITGVMQAGSIIKNSIDNFKFDKLGCKRIVDQIKRNDCEARVLDKHIAELRNQLPYCKKSKTPDECEARIKDEIVKKTQDKVELKNLTTLADTGSLEG